MLNNYVPPFKLNNKKKMRIKFIIWKIPQENEKKNKKRGYVGKYPKVKL
jgi:hypothetical protein